MIQSSPQRLEIARRLRLLRRESGLSMADLCAASGVSAQTISALETAQRGGHLETFVALTDALGIEVGDLIAGLPDVRNAAARELWRRAA
jgi:transcriptional regulator with XRE-family HTH domain